MPSENRKSTKMSRTADLLALVGQIERIQQDLLIVQEELARVTLEDTEDMPRETTRQFDQFREVYSQNANKAGYRFGDTVKIIKHHSKDDGLHGKTGIVVGTTRHCVYFLQTGADQEPRRKSNHYVRRI